MNKQTQTLLALAVLGGVGYYFWNKYQTNKIVKVVNASGYRPTPSHTTAVRKVATKKK